MGQGTSVLSRKRSFESRASFFKIESAVAVQAKGIGLALC